MTAVALDPNNNLYPLAYFVVGSETREACEYVLELLVDDLNIERFDKITFISEKQKGLILAFRI